MRGLPYGLGNFVPSSRLLQKVKEVEIVYAYVSEFVFSGLLVFSIERRY